MRHVLTAAAVAALLGLPAGADEIEDALSRALDAYRAGDFALAKEETDYASTLLAERKAAGLKGFLPDALTGWTRRDEADGAQSLGAFGGGIVASASYTGDRGEVTVTLMADNQLVASMAAMLSNTAFMSQMGTVRRTGRQTYVITQDGTVQALVAGRILAQVEGSAPVEDKTAYFEAIDFAALAGF